MELQLRFDEQMMRRYHDRGSPPFFCIYWQHEHTAYPASNWTDFGGVILGWWLVAAHNLLQGAHSQELLFMDGPYSLKAEREGGLLRFTAKDLSGEWECTLQHFTAELIKAAESTINELKRLSIDPSGQRILGVGINQLANFRGSQDHREK